MRRCSFWRAERGGTTARAWVRESYRWEIGWRWSKRDAGSEMRDALSSDASRILHPVSRHLVPRQRSRFLAPLADHLLHIRLEPLAVAARGTHGVREGEQAPHSLNFARLAPHDAPALGGMIPDLEEAPIHGYVAPVHVQHHDVARRDADDRIPRTPTQQMGAGPTDPGPALGLEPRGCHRAEGSAHARTIPGSRDGSRD